jgi:precorrin-2/cobalt-factor-2 C20-methyltransferase
MLIGLGLGPGDPELLTLRAVRLLKSADRVFVPGRLAYDLVSPYAEAVILDFPMTSDEGRITSSMEENSRRIMPLARVGTVVLGILGDPNFYSTFSRLCSAVSRLYPEVECRTEPGISSVTAFASVANIPMSGGFIVSDGALPSSRILLKVRRPIEKAAALKKEGFRHFVLVERMYMEDQKIYEDDGLPEHSDYFSVMYAGP